MGVRVITIFGVVGGGDHLLSAFAEDTPLALPSVSSTAEASSSEKTNLGTTDLLEGFAEDVTGYDNGPMSVTFCASICRSGMFSLESFFCRWEHILHTTMSRVCHIYGTWHSETRSFQS